MHPSWKHALAEYLASSDFSALNAYVQDRRKNSIVFPPEDLTFAAFKIAIADVKVVILGQDPYHGVDGSTTQAHGLAFSVPQGVAIPPSLKNVLKEIGMSHKEVHGDLTGWMDQGVFLLNSVLTVEKGLPRSHAGKGWEKFTQHVIDILNNSDHRIIFMAWGSDAQKVCKNIDTEKHLLLQSSHPSPLGCKKANPVAFEGSNHFSLANDDLTSRSLEPIDWKALTRRGIETPENCFF